MAEHRSPEISGPRRTFGFRMSGSFTVDRQDRPVSPVAGSRVMRNCRRWSAIAWWLDPQSVEEDVMRRATQSESGRLVSVLCLGVLLSLARPAAAQDIYGGVVGVVRDAQGGVLTGVVVTLVNRDSGQRREVKTN